MSSLPDQTGKVFVVTGANTGIGEVTARELARAGARVFVACRSESKAQDAMDRIRADVPDANLEFVALDLSSLAKVRKSAEELSERVDVIDGLINNAGLAALQGQTEDGYELAFGVNHLGHFLFTLLLIDKVIAADAGRIVNVSSKAHYSAKSIPWDDLQKRTPHTSGIPEYAVSKLANVLFTFELEKRLQGTNVTTYALHPGVVASDIWGRRIGGKLATWVAGLFMITVEQGAQTTLHCATAADAVEQSGLYWDESKVRRHNRVADDEALQAELWKRSLEWSGAPDYPR